MNRFAMCVSAAVLACMLAFPSGSGARPVNPAQGWLFDIEVGGAGLDQNFSAPSYYRTTILPGLPSFDVPSGYVNPSQGSGGLIFGLGYGWRRFDLQLLLGVRGVGIEWDQVNSSTGALISELNAGGVGGAFGARAAGTVWKGKALAIDVCGSFLVSSHEDVTVEQKSAATGETKAFADPLPYSSSMLFLDAGIDTTFSWRAGNWVPWLSIGARTQSTSMDLQVKATLFGTEYIPLDLEDFSTKSESTFASAIGINWNFNRNGTLWIAGNLANPSGALLGLTLCSGARAE